MLACALPSFSTGSLTFVPPPTSRRKEESSRVDSSSKALTGHTDVIWHLFLMNQVLISKTNSFLFEILCNFFRNNNRWRSCIYSSVDSQKWNSTSEVVAFGGTLYLLFQLRVPGSSRWLFQTLPVLLALPHDSYLTKWKLAHLFCHF